MREIKFKRYFQHGDTGNICCIQIDRLFGIHQSPSARHFQIGLCQYTGLKDKNGKEMYEGDVLKGKRFVGRGEWSRFIGLVAYIGSKFIVEGVRKNDGIYEDLHCGYEVIGNIYEHPHLLEQGLPKAIGTTESAK